MIQIEPKDGRPTCVLYRTDGSSEEIPNALYPDDAGWLAWVQNLVGGYVQRYPSRIAHVTSLWCNEDGIPLGLDENDAILEHFGILLFGDCVVYLRNV